MEDKERTVLEDGLLTGLVEQIHSRTTAARDLVRNMDADTRARPMSSGTTVGIHWVASDSLTDSQKAVSKLLEKNASGLAPASLAELCSHLRSQIRTKAAADKEAELPTRDRRSPGLPILAQVRTAAVPPGHE